MISNQDIGSLKYVGMLLTSGVWIATDIYFLVKLNKIKKEQKNDNKSCTLVKTNVSSQTLILIVLLMIDFVYKYKIASIAGSIAYKIGNLLTISIVSLFVLPTFLSYNIVMNNSGSIYSDRVINSLIGYHSIAITLKTILLIMVFLPATKNNKMIKFMVKPELTYNSSGLSPLVVPKDIAKAPVPTPRSEVKPKAPEVKPRPEVKPKAPIEISPSSDSALRKRSSKKND